MSTAETEFLFTQLAIDRPDKQQWLEKVDRASGNNRLHIAAACGHVAVINYLRTETSLSVNARNLSGQTPLHLAIINGHRSAACALLHVWSRGRLSPDGVSVQLSPGADPTLRDQHGATAWNYALATGRSDLMGLFDGVPLALLGMTENCVTESRLWRLHPELSASAQANFAAMPAQPFGTASQAAPMFGTSVPAG